MELEEGKVHTAVMFFYQDGFMFRWTPGGLPVKAVSNVHFDLQGKRDEFGVPPHTHDDVQLSAASDLEGKIDFLAANAKEHGPPFGMSSMLFKRVGRYVVQMYGTPPSPYGGSSGYMVSALAPQGEGDPEMTAEKVLELGRTGAKVESPEHDHWFASEKPMPFSAALWIFQSVTEANIAATNCNCEPTMRRGRGVEPFLMPDESFVGDDIDVAVADADG